MKNSGHLVHAQFVEAFAGSRVTVPISAVDLQAAAHELNTVFPASYRNFAQENGAVYTPAILRGIMAVELDHPDLRQFLCPREIIGTTRMLQFSGDFPQLIAFAIDCMGNPFCFERRSADMSESPVFFIAQGAREAMEVEPAFDALVEWYVKNLSTRKNGAISGRE